MVDVVRCSRCEASLPGVARYCRRCGALVSGSTRIMTAAPPRVGRKRRVVPRPQPVRTSRGPWVAAVVVMGILGMRAMTVLEHPTWLRVKEPVAAPEPVEVFTPEPLRVPEGPGMVPWRDGVGRYEPEYAVPRLPHPPRVREGSRPMIVVPAVPETRYPEGRLGRRDAGD